MERNIKLAYLICFFRYTWFWFGIWVFYYLLYTNYAGIALIETSLITSFILSEIPTGIIADLLGKKHSLLLSFFLQAVGILILALVPSLPNLIIGVFIAGVGVCFYSGTFEAIIYDSLKQINKESVYTKVISNINAISLFAIAICSIIGGFMYKMWPPLPTLSSAIGYIIAFIFCLFLTEPKIDSEKFTIRNSIYQVKHAMFELFKSKNIVRQTFLLLSIGIIVVIADEMINAFLGIEFGFGIEEQGIFWAFVLLISSLSSRLTPWLKKAFKEYQAVLIIGTMLAFTLIISPLSGKYLGGLSLIIRSSLQIIYLNFVSIGINSVTESKYRTTTLSVFNMLRNIPYVFFAYFIGALSEVYSAKNIASWMGVLLLLFLIIQIIVLPGKKLNMRKLKSSNTITP